MKMYKVFELADYRFTWAGGCLINIYCIKGNVYVNDRVDIIEFYETYNDREVASLCLEWLENRGIIDDASPYLSWNEPEKKSDRRQDMLAEES
jgi:hypothetical protein